MKIIDFIKQFLVFGLIGLISLSCNKQWLEEKQNLNTVIPISLTDMRAILRSDVSPSMANDYAGLSLESCDDYSIAIDVYNDGTEHAKNVFKWERELFTITGSVIQDCNNSYTQIFNTNVALEGLQKIVKTSSNSKEWNDVKGNGLFYRAKAFYNLSQLFAPSFDLADSKEGLGMPIRLSSDPNPATKRSSVKETYERILTDLKDAVPLLTDQPRYKTDASKQAAYALLARCYLSMRNYEYAFRYADSCLQITDDLIDYNTLSIGTDRDNPISTFNIEVILHCELVPVSAFSGPGCIVNPELFALYDEDDLRRKILFLSTGEYRAHYSGKSTPFSGLTTGEMYLIRSECFSRKGNNESALEDLNTLLRKRYLSNMFRPYNVNNTANVLELILQERRKELVFRGQRWSDLRRLNTESAHAVTLTRDLDGVIYSLFPNDSRYTLPIPDYVIKATGINQNNRN